MDDYDDLHLYSIGGKVGDENPTITSLYIAVDADTAEMKQLIDAFRTDSQSPREFAKYLRSEGYTVLTFDGSTSLHGLEHVPAEDDTDGR